jgi:Apea-like HEPN
MNTSRIKQIFQISVERVAESFDSDVGKGPRSGRIPTIRGGVALPERASEAYIQALDDIVAIAEADGTWSRPTVDDVLWEHVERVLQASPDERASVIRSQGAEIAKRFGEPLSRWTVDLLLYGIDLSCAGLGFGRVAFLSDEVSVDEGFHSVLGELVTRPQVFARLDTTAIDEGSAIQRASGILDEHLMILNALCSFGRPSLIRVSQVDHIHRTNAVYRVGKSIDSMGSMGFQAATTRIPLMRPELESVLKHKLGTRISEMLSSPGDEFSKRVISGYALSGAACVDAHPERGFLMFAIALESVVLGRDTKSELTHQLATRVAHLIGNGQSGRKHVAKWVENLYDRRSKIVHRGEYGVSRTESGLIQLYSMAALAMLVLSAAFKGFTTIAELEAWFKERTLEGPSDFGPESQQTAE